MEETREILKRVVEGLELADKLLSMDDKGHIYISQSRTVILGSMARLDAEIHRD